MMPGLWQFLLIVGAILTAGCVGVIVCALLTAAGDVDECGWPIASDQGIVPCPMTKPCPIHDREAQQ